MDWSYGSGRPAQPTLWVVLVGIALVGVAFVALVLAMGDNETDHAAQLRLAQDRQAQFDLRNGLTAAKVFFTDNTTYDGFTKTAASEIEPLLSWAGDRRAS